MLSIDENGNLISYAAPNINKFKNISIPYIDEILMEEQLKSTLNSQFGKDQYSYNISDIVLVVNCSIITIFADNYDDTSEIKNIYDSTEIGEVFQTIENDALINNSTATYENSEQKINNEELSPYKIYSISPQEFSDINIDYVVKNKIKSDDYKWIVPDNNKRGAKYNRIFYFGKIII